MNTLNSLMNMNSNDLLSETLNALQGDTGEGGLAQILSRTGLDKSSGSTTPGAQDGDTATWSEEARALSAGIGVQGIDLSDTLFTKSSVKTKLGADEITFNNKNGKITWNGVDLNLKGVGNALKDDIVIQRGETDELNVYVYAADNSVKSYRLSTVDGSMIKKGDGSPETASKASPDSSSSALYISNVGSRGASVGGNADDVLINRKAGNTVSGGAGDDKIFNFAASVTSLEGGAGDDEVYTVGLSGGAINTGTGTENAYVKTLGNLKNTTIAMGNGSNKVDAKGMTLTSVNISDQGGYTDLAAASLVGTAANKGKVELQGQAKVDISSSVNHYDLSLGVGGTETQDVAIAKMSNSTLKTGGGKDWVKFASLTNSSVDLGDGDNSLDVAKAVNGLTYEGGSDKDDLWFGASLSNANIDLGGGENSLEASKVDAKGKKIYQTISNTNINASGKTTIDAGKFATGKNGNAIKLLGGANTVNLTSVSGGKLDMELGSDGSDPQVLNVAGAVNNLNYVGSRGKDDILINGAVSNSTFDLGAGENFLEASKTDAKGKKTYQTISNTDISASGKTNINAGKFATGKNGNKVELLGGANTVNLSSISGGKLDMELGSDVSDSQALNVGGAVSNLNYTGSKGRDEILINGAISNSAFDLGGGENSLEASKTDAKGKKTYQTISNTDITAGAGKTTISAGRFATGKNGNKVDLLGGANTVNLSSISGGKLDMTLGGSGVSHNQALNVAGAVNNLNYAGSKGNDAVAIQGAVSNSDFDLGAGKNTLTASKVNAKGQTVYQKMTNTNIASTGNATVEAGAFVIGANGNTMALGGASNSVRLSSVSGGKLDKKTGIQTVLDMKLGGSGTQTQTLDVAGSVKNLKYTGGAGKDVVQVLGSISNSDFDLGKGENILSAIGTNKEGEVIGKAITNTNIKSSGDTVNDSTVITAKSITNTKGASYEINMNAYGKIALIA